MSSSALNQIANALQNGIGIDLNLTGYTWEAPAFIGEQTPNSSIFTSLSTVALTTSSFTISGGLQATPIGTAQSNVANFTSAAISSLTANDISGRIGTQTSNLAFFTAATVSSLTGNYISAPQALFSSITALNVLGPVGLNSSNIGNFTDLEFSTSVGNAAYFSSAQISSLQTTSNSTTTLLASTITSFNVLAATLSTGTTTAGILNAGTLSTGLLSLSTLNVNTISANTVRASTFIGAVGLQISSAAAFTNVNVSTLTATNGITNTGTTAVQQIVETLTVRSSLTGTVTHDWTSSAVWYHSSLTANISCALTNLPATANRSLVVSLILNQGSTPYYASTLTVNGTLTPIRWATGTTPTPAANKIEVESFTLFYVGTTWTALGQYTSFG